MSGLTRALDGMTCASCASRIEKRLNKIDGAHATARRHRVSEPRRCRSGRRREWPTVAVGRLAWLRDEQGLEPAAELLEAADQAEARGQTPVWVAVDGEIRAVVVVADTVKDTAAEAIRDLRRLGLHPILLTGDGERAARAVAAQIGIDDVIAGVLPAGKADHVKRLQAEGRVVAMVGDGVNDAPRWRGPISDWRWAPVPTLRSRPPT